MMDWDYDLLAALSEVSGIPQRVLRYHVVRMMRELYYGEPEIRTRGGKRSWSINAFRGRPTPTLEQFQARMKVADASLGEFL